MKTQHAFMVAVLLVGAPATSWAQAPATGFYLDARLSSLNLPGFTSGALGGPAPASIGYRGEGYTLGIAPAFHRAGVTTTACAVEPTTGGCLSDNTESDGAAVNVLGAQLLGTYAFADFAESRGELYGLGGLLLGGAFVTGDDDASSDTDELGNPLAFGITAGVGARYFLDPHVGLGVEIGEGWVSLPLSSSATRSERASLFTTWGALTVQIVF